MLTIAFVKWGALYSADYVNILADMVSRNLMEGYPGKFVCYTDDPTGLDERIEARVLPKGLEGWWGKLYLFNEFKEGKTLFLDLDTVIVGALDDVVACDKPFVILRDFYRPDGWQSSMMLWEGDYSHIWQHWVTAGQPRLEGGDQAWIEYILPQADIWQDLYPNAFVSYKAGKCSVMFPPEAKVVIFHGEPRPHECGGWVEKVWKIGGGTTAELEVVANVAVDKIKANIAANMDKGFPMLQMQKPHDRVAMVCAGGPSLNDDLEEIRFLKSQGADLITTNGVMDHLHMKGIHSNMHVMLDARPENVEFVKARRLVDYLMASQVDPKIIRMLGDRDVTLWHSYMPGIDLEGIKVGGSTTVGLKAVIIAYVLGYREIHLFGFDSCYRDSHHAYPQALNDGERVINVNFADQDFRCAPWMAQQAREFKEVVPELVKMGCEIYVHGEGLIPTIADHMIPVKTAADERAEAILERLPDGQQTGVEVGVFAGDLSRRLLNKPNLFLYMVDAWEGEGKSYEGDSGDWHANLSQKQQDEYMHRAESVTTFAADRRKIVKAYSHVAANDFADHSLDFVFIDADHGYEGCKRDIEAWVNKVKPGGLLCGHDYENTDFPKFGVTKAVNEFVSSRQLTVDLGSNFTWFVHP